MLWANLLLVSETAESYFPRFGFVQTTRDRGRLAAVRAANPPQADYLSENVRPVVNRLTRGVDSSRWTKNVR